MAGERRRVTWTDEARSALDEALSYIAQDSPQGARSVLEHALEAADSPATLSHRGRVVPEQDDPTIREVFVGRYRLL
jgi:toxin ParE1/3/4